MPDGPLILLPPSEGKRRGGTGPSWSPGTMQVDLDEARGTVMNALIDAMHADIGARSRLLGVKGDALAEATTANLELLRSPTMPAIERYDGVLYGAMDAGSLDVRSRKVLERSVLIFSGLWGLVAPADPIPLYKLKMGARRDPLGRLSTWWRPAIAEALDGRGAGRTVWNLLPGEHAAALGCAWAGSGVPKQHCTVTFLQPNASGEMKAVSHWNKFLKGALVRHLVENPGITPLDLRDWEHPSGFVLDETLTTSTTGRTKLVFVKDERTRADPQRPVRNPT